MPKKKRAYLLYSSRIVKFNTYLEPASVLMCEIFSVTFFALLCSQTMCFEEALSKPICGEQRYSGSTPMSTLHSAYGHCNPSISKLPWSDSSIAISFECPSVHIIAVLRCI